MRSGTARSARTARSAGRFNRLAASVALALGGAGAAGLAAAVEFATGNPDLSVRWDNALRPQRRFERVMMPELMVGVGTR